MASGTVRFGTYNLLDLFAADTAEHQRHYETVAGVIRDLAADVLAVQEILAPDAETAARRLRQLAGDAGLNCEVPGPGGSSGSEAAIAFGGHGYHVGLMWRDGIEPVPGSLRCYGGRDFWHGLALLTLDVGGPLIRHGSFHASPFGRRLRADQNERLVAAVTRPRGEPPVLVGADWNTESADRRPDGTLYEAGRPLRRPGVVRRPDLPVPMGLRRTRPAPALGRPGARGRAVGGRPARRGRGHRRDLAAHHRPPPF